VGFGAQGRDERLDARRDDTEEGRHPHRESDPEKDVYSQPVPRSDKIDEDLGEVHADGDGEHREQTHLQGPSRNRRARLTAATAPTVTPPQHRRDHAATNVMIPGPTVRSGFIAPRPIIGPTKENMSHAGAATASPVATPSASAPVARWRPQKGVTCQTCQ